MKPALLPIGRIENRILVVRGQKVLLDSDLSALYGVETRVLNQAVKRNLERFPADFMFRLSAKEFESWRSQIVMSKPGAIMGLRRAPFAFTEHGALMAASVLNTSRAVEVGLYVVRAFVRLRETLAAYPSNVGLGETISNAAVSFLNSTRVVALDPPEGAPVVTKVSSSV